jgi:hypothetical protein
MKSKEIFMSIPKIESYRFGRIVIDGETYQKDVIIFPEGVQPNWWREQGHSLSLDDLKDVLAARPKTLILGTGTFGRMQIPAETLTKIKAAGIEVVAHKTEKACQVYNERKDEGNVIAAFHLTC